MTVTVLLDVVWTNKNVACWQKGNCSARHGLVRNDFGREQPGSIISL